LRTGWALDTISHRDLAERTATFAAAANIGASFAPNLLARKPLDQAIATGLSASISYGVANLTQSFIDGLSRRIAPGRDRAPTESRKYLNTIANVTAIAGGLGLQKLFVAEHGEPVKRAAMRTIGWELTASGFAGLGITAAVGGMQEVARRRGGTLHPAVLPVGFVVGTVMSGAGVLWSRRNQEGSAPLVNSLAQGAVVMAGVTTVGYAETRLAGAVASAVRGSVPGLALLAEPIGHAVGLGLLATGVALGVEVVNRQAEQGGAAIEAAYLTPTESPFVSGGSDSEVAWDTLSREGRRFVNMALTPAEIGNVTGHEGIAPIRAFVGLDSADTVDARVWLMMKELEKLGAFERSVICLSSPTGTGYINYVAAESLEYLTRGDCAILAIQYSLRPSFLSLDKVKIGREQNRALLHAISGRLMGIPPERRPRLVALGESLGAFTLQDAFLHEGTSGLTRAGVSNALFIGTPAESKWAEQWRLEPQRFDPAQQVVEVDGYEEWLELPPEIRAGARYVLLSHHEDPITKFSPALAVQAPRWLSNEPTRSPAIADGVTWRPFTTFILTAVDMKNATKVIPGKFEALGHDYRADLARFTSLAFELPVAEEELARIEVALREREFHWAEARVTAEAVEQTKESIARTLNSWGVSTDELPSGLAGLASLSSGSSA
jgi:uncharacterized membrane protein